MAVYIQYRPLNEWKFIQPSMGTIGHKELNNIADENRLLDAEIECMLKHYLPTTFIKGLKPRGLPQDLDNIARSAILSINGRSVVYTYLTGDEMKRCGCPPEYDNVLGYFGSKKTRFIFAL